MIRAKNYETVSKFVKVMPKILWPLFSRHGVFVLYADVRKNYNVKRLRGSGDPTTRTVLLQHTHSQNFIAVKGNQVLCIPLKHNDPSCKFIAGTHAYYPYVVIADYGFLFL